MSKDPSTTSLFGTLLSLYMLTVMGMGVYCNWHYAPEHGFVEWFFLGEIVPSAKALVWPYFLFGMDKTSHVSAQRDTPVNRFVATFTVIASAHIESKAATRM